MKNKKIKMTDTKKWLGKVLLSMIIFFVIAITIFVPLINKDKLDFSWLIILLFSMFGYCIYAYITTNMYVTKEEFLEITKNYAPEVVVSMLRRRNFNDKEINEIMLKRGTAISLKKDEEALTPEVEKAIDAFNKLEGWKKVDFKNNLPKYYNSPNISWKDEDLEEYTKFCDKYNFSDYSEYEYFEKYINTCLNENVDKYYQLAKKELKKYYDTNHYSDGVSTKVLSVSNKKLKDKIEKDHERIKLLFHDNELLLLSNEFKRFNYDEDSQKDDEKWYFIDNYRENKCYVEDNIIDRIKYDDIIFYVPEGNIDVNTIVSGGGMSGKNISGLGAEVYQNNKMPFAPTGDAGAVYSMLKDIKIDPIKTDVVTTDNRVVVLKTNNMDLVFTREDKELFYPNKVEDLYSWLVDKMPEKDFERISLKNSKESNSNSDSNLDEIKKLKELLDMDAITQEEFDKKKKELLK